MFFKPGQRTGDMALVCLNEGRQRILRDSGMAADCVCRWRRAGGLFLREKHMVSGASEKCCPCFGVFRAFAGNAILAGGLSVFCESSGRLCIRFAGEWPFAAPLRLRRTGVILHEAGRRPEAGRSRGRLLSLKGMKKGRRFPKGEAAAFAVEREKTSRSVRP